MFANVDDFMSFAKRSMLLLGLVALVSCGKAGDRYDSGSQVTADDSVGVVETFPDRPDLAARLGEGDYSEYETSAGASGMGSSSYSDSPDGAESKSYFDFNKYNVRSDAAAVLRRQASWLMSNPEIRLVVAGHCDTRGSREYNLALGERRANAIKDFLVSQGVSASRISTVSYGKERPAALGDTEAAHALNRRAVATIAR